MATVVETFVKIYHGFAIYKCGSKYRIEPKHLNVEWNKSEKKYFDSMGRVKRFINTYR